jgi:TRAP-type C4-dicarboxylate transport system permease large subunit
MPFANHEKAPQDVLIGTTYESFLPFVADIIHLTLLILFPQIALFLPGLMG